MTSVSPTQIVAQVPASLIATHGTVPVVVASDLRSSSRRLSNSQLQLPLRPRFSGLSPSAATAGGAGFTLTMTGAGFFANSMVDWNGSPLPTNFVSSTQLTASVSSSLIASAGSASVAVSSGGQTSASSLFTISPATVRTSVNTYANLAAYTAATGTAIVIGFNGVLPTGTQYVSFNPLVISGVSFSTQASGTYVNLTAANYYSPNNYPAAFIVDAGSTGATNTLNVTFPSTYAVALDVGQLSGGGTGEITLSKRIHVQLAACQRWEILRSSVLFRPRHSPGSLSPSTATIGWSKIFALACRLKETEACDGTASVLWSQSEATLTSRNG